MKMNIYSKLHALSDRIPISVYLGITKQKLILPFYHTVTNVPKPHLKHLSYYRTKDDFEKDVYFFKKHFNSISISALGLKIKRPSFHITFDDGLSDIMTEAVPFLVSNKIHATFFINSDFVDNKYMFYRHKVSVILYYLENKELLKKTSKFLNIKTCQVIDYLINLEYKDNKHIDLIALNLSIDFDEYLKNNKPYLTSTQILELIGLGFTIGNHGKSHPNFDGIDLDDQMKEVVSGTDFLNTFPFKIKDNYFSFPFGSDNRSNEFYKFLYKTNKVCFSFGVSGLKRDEQKRHFHRTEMEYVGINGSSIIKFEYFYYLIKAIFNKNTLKRVGDEW